VTNLDSVRQSLDSLSRAKSVCPRDKSTKKTEPDCQLKAAVWRKGETRHWDQSDGCGIRHTMLTTRYTAEQHIQQRLIEWTSRD
jgi:hypothetical protein